MKRILNVFIFLIGLSFSNSPSVHASWYGSVKQKTVQAWESETGKKLRTSSALFSFSLGACSLALCAYLLTQPLSLAKDNSSIAYNIRKRLASKNLFGISRATIEALGNLFILGVFWVNECSSYKEPVDQKDVRK